MMMINDDDYTLHGSNSKLEFLISQKVQGLELQMKRKFSIPVTRRLAVAVNIPPGISWDVKHN